MNYKLNYNLQLECQPLPYSFAIIITITIQYLLCSINLYHMTYLH